ncbi:hypothetical protein HX773_03100 [Pantoea sp. B9002]|uniref:class I SAM-dependent methyltransferase n=1 Tax=Pantoea sp. B9002 TaxID=2726979 RepID=UPI0015A14796|nr:class I SAM-dependent methyltransferase [Pantoea sp. B9002]NWA59877.1 hypothetical protein [Pantoea sp. B9002]
MRTDLIEDLKSQLKNEADSGKHALYQTLPIILQEVLGNVDYTPGSRFEVQRLDFMKKIVDLSHCDVIDIGCNLGFFSFSAISAEASHVTSIEGNYEHAKFVEKSIDVLSLQEKMEIINCYFDFRSFSDKYDVGFLLNVLHHVGDDYGDKTLNLGSIKDNILRELNGMAPYCHRLLFQLGFNWRGNKGFPLFEKGSKKEMIEFIEQGTNGYWKVKEIGVAIRSYKNDVVYEKVNADNVKRDDSLGEFLNRPIFLLESKCF